MKVGLEPTTRCLTDSRSNQLSYIILDSKTLRGDRRDSNSRKPESQSGTLPTELLPHLSILKLVLPLRIELRTMDYKTIIIPFNYRSKRALSHALYIILSLFTGFNYTNYQNNFELFRITLHQQQNNLGMSPDYLEDDQTVH